MCVTGGGVWGFVCVFVCYFVSCFFFVLCLFVFAAAGHEVFFRCSKSPLTAKLIFSDFFHVRILSCVGNLFVFIRLLKR